MNNNFYIGKRIKINSMNGEPNYAKREGVVTMVDDTGQLHGTWGGLAINPEEDYFTIID